MKIIVTGGANGIGKAIVEYFKENHQIIVMDKESSPFNHPNVEYVQGDLKKEKDLDILIESVDSQADVLINNAMESHAGILSQCDYYSFLDSQLVGVVAPYYLSLKIKNLKRIINMTSTRAHMSQKDTESYSAAKGGLLSLTHALSISLGPNTLVNAISPGWIDTTDSEFDEKDKGQHPVNRVGNPMDIVNLVEFLISDQSSFITGQEFVVDGGMSKQMIYHNDNGWSYQQEV